MTTFGTVKQALLANYKPELNARDRPSEPTIVVTPLITYRISFVSVSGWLYIFLAAHSSMERRRMV
uniref:Uncharacterized protein n=1 Tax=Mesocestoides corti TaxID=53468 RepID=A0A5K3EV82_MESCO